MKINLSRVLRAFAIAIGVLILVLYLGMPAAMGVFALLPARETVGAAPQGFSEVSLLTQDGVRLAGWYHSPDTRRGAAILLLHGAGGSREGVRAYADLLARYGYGVLALDLRGHGASEGKTNRLGWQGTPDVGAAVRYLQGLGEVKSIGGLGISMGGEVLLGAAAEYPALSAIATDGATRRCTAELLALPSERPLVRNFTARVMFTTVELLGGAKPPSPLLDSMLAAKSTRFLWIAGGANAQEVAFNRLFAETLAERGRLWVAPRAAHTAAFGLYADEYEERLVGFFDEALVGE